MTSLTFYGGINEIGGNKIILEDKDTKVFLDFGKGFARRAKFFEEYINPRTSNGIVDFLTMGLVPDISGVYRDDLMVTVRRFSPYLLTYFGIYSQIDAPISQTVSS